MLQPAVTAVLPPRAIEGGRITLVGEGFFVDRSQLPDLRVQNQPARVVFASPRRVSIIVPGGLTEGGPTPIRFGSGGRETVFIDIASPIAKGLHQVDNPVID